MKVLLFTDSDVFAGTERHMLDLAGGLRAQRVEVAIGCPVPGALATQSEGRGIEVHAIGKHGLLDWRAVHALRSLCRKRGFEILHSHNGRTAFLAACAATLTGNARCVYTQHFLEPSYVGRRGIKGKISHAMHGWVNRRTDHLIANSLSTAQGAIARGEVISDRVTVIPNGVAPPDVASLRPLVSVRDELALGSGASLIVCAARLEPEKDVATLIDAMSIVRQQFPNTVCVVAGEGTLREQLQQQIAGSGMERSVRLLGFRTDVASIINAGDLFVLPSVAEPFGLALVEAMSLGKPVVAVAAGGPTEIVDEGRSGLLVPPRNAIELARAIVSLLASEESRRLMGLRGEERFRARFTVERMALETITVYERVLSSATAGSAYSGRPASISS